MRSLHLLLFIVLFYPVITLNIVVFVSLVGKSHLDFASNLVDLLTERGHSVDFILARLNDAITSNGTTSARKVFNIPLGEKGYWQSQVPHLNSFFEPTPRDFVDVSFYHGIALKMCEVALKKGVTDFIKSGNYDIAITSDYDFCGTSLMRSSEVPSVATFVPTPLVASQWVSAGIPTPASVFTGPMSGPHDGSFFDRAFHLLKAAYYINIFRPSQVKEFNALFREYFGNTSKDVEEMSRDTDLIFVNSNEIIEKPRPISHKVKYIGGIQMRKPKPLSKELNELLNISQRGTVIFSFGTQVPTSAIPFQIRKNFAEAFKNFPDVCFLWKYDPQSDDSEIFNNITNVKRVSWLPQTDLLRKSEQTIDNASSTA